MFDLQRILPSILSVALVRRPTPASCGDFELLFKVAAHVLQEHGLLTALAAQGETRNEIQEFCCTFFSASIAVVLSIGAQWGMILAGPPRSRSSDFISSCRGAYIPVRKSSA
jgi:hypothetical protein